MSLYEGSPIHNKVPEAKLSTLASTANKDQVESAIVPRTVTALPLLLGLALFFFTLSLHSYWFPVELTRKTQRLLPLRFPPASFLRPPPFPLHG